ncbi:MAG: TonB-dependent receptor [Rubricoccaceae bacterium]
MPVAAGRLYADLDYDGINTGNGERYVPFDRFAGRAGVQTYGPTRLRVEGFGLREGYGMVALAPEVRRVRSHYGGAGALEGVGAVPFGLALRYSFSRVAPADALDELALGEASEGRVSAEARLGLFGGRLRLDAAGSTAGLDGGVGGDERHGAVGAALALGRDDGARLVAGVRALAYRASEANGLGQSTTFGPVVGLGLPLGPALRVFATNEPRLRTRSLHELFSDNPFAVPDALVAPDVRPLDAEAGLELRRGPLRARAFVLATYATNELHFQSSAGGLYSAVYAGTRTAGLAADATLTFGRGASVSAAFALRDGALTDGGGTLPFYAPLVGRLGAQVPFDGARGRLGLAAYAEGARPTDPTGEFTAPAWAQLDLDARYTLSGPLALVVRAERLAGTAERWPGYPYAPYTVLGGLRLAW